MDRAESGLSRLAGLARKVDRAFAAIHRRRASCMECRAGCSDCCRARLSITRVEEAFLRRGLSQMPQPVRAELARRARDGEREMCPALDADGRCGVYAWRPLICRSYGVPLRRRREVELINPPLIDVCDKNFIGMALQATPAADVIDQTELEAELEEIDAEHCERNDLPRRERVPIASILADDPGR